MSDELIKMLSSRLDRIDGHTREMAAHGANVDVTLARQAVLLEEHIRRTNLLEQRVEQEARDAAETLAPIKRHVEGLQFLLKVVGAATAVVGLIGGVLKLLYW